MSFIKEIRLFAQKILVDDMKDFDDVRSKTLNKHFKKTKSIIEYFFVLVLSSLKTTKRRPKRGNYFKKDIVVIPKRNNKIKVADLHYIILIKIVDIMDLF